MRTNKSEHNNLMLLAVILPIFSLFIALIVVGLVSRQNTSVVDTSSDQTYVNDLFNYRLTHPREFLVNDRDSSLVRLKSDEGVYVEISYIKFNNDENFDTLLSKLNDDVRNCSNTSSSCVYLRDTLLLDEMKIRNRRALSFEFTLEKTQEEEDSLKNYNTRIYNAYIEYDGGYFIINCNAPENMYNDNLDAFKKIITSFEV